MIADIITLYVENPVTMGAFTLTAALIVTVIALLVYSVGKHSELDL